MSGGVLVSGLDVVAEMVVLEDSEVVYNCVLVSVVFSAAVVDFFSASPS